MLDEFMDDDPWTDEAAWSQMRCETLLEDRGKSLRCFAEWFLECGELWGEDLRVGPFSSELILFSDQPYQATLVTLFPGYRVPPHYHPNVTSWDVLVTGNGAAVVGGHRFTDLGDARMDLEKRIPVPAGVVHGGYTKNGAVFLSFQRWHNGVAPTFLSEDWVDA